MAEENGNNRPVLNNRFVGNKPEVPVKPNYYWTRKALRHLNPGLRSRARSGSFFSPNNKSNGSYANWELPFNLAFSSSNNSANNNNGNVLTGKRKRGKKGENYNFTIGNYSNENSNENSNNNYSGRVRIIPKKPNRKNSTNSPKSRKSRKTRKARKTRRH